MAMKREGIPINNESLIFPSGQEAQEFAERVEGRVEKKSSPGVVRDREVLAEEVANEFTQHGEDVGSYEQPWSHDEKEHQEVQELVDLAFSEDLSVALKEARKSNNYPRLIDLFHDVLVDQMYKAMKQGQVNEQKVGSKFLLIGGSLVVALVLAAIIILVI